MNNNNTDGGMELDIFLKLICEKRFNFRWIGFDREFYNKNVSSEYRLTEYEYELIQTYYNMYK